MYIQIFIAGFIIMLSAFSGKLLMWGTFGSYIQKNLKFLVSLALGVFTATFFLILQEVREFQNASLLYIIISLLLGAVVLEIIQNLIPEAHHHHGQDETECCNSHIKKTLNPKRILIGDAFHNIGDGFVLVPAYLINFQTGLILTIGIFIHEFIQETSEFFLLKQAGYSTKKALWSNFIVQGSIFIGIVIAIFISKASDYEYLLISFSMGALLYIILRDLLPHTLERIKHEGNKVKHISMALVGFIIMITLNLFIAG